MFSDSVLILKTPKAWVLPGLEVFASKVRSDLKIFLGVDSAASCGAVRSGSKLFASERIYRNVSHEKSAFFTVSGACKAVNQIAAATRSQFIVGNSLRAVTKPPCGVKRVAAFPRGGLLFSAEVEMSRPTGGYVKWHRKIKNHWLGKDGYSRAILDYLLRDANWFPATEMLGRQRVYLKRGELATSLKEISENTWFAKRIIIDRLKRLSDDGIICQKISKHGRIIFICNYEKYQADDTGIDTDGDTPFDTPWSTDSNTVSGTHIEEEKKRRSTFIARKNSRTKKSKKSPSPSAKGKLYASELISAIRHQYQLNRDNRPFGSESEANEHAKGIVSSEAWTYMRESYASWRQFAEAYADQHARGYGEIFEKNLAEKFKLRLQSQEVGDAQPN